MLKTNVDSIARPRLSLILYGILSGYVRHPLVTFLRILSGLPKIARGLSREYPEDLRKTCALIISMYRTFGKILDPSQALALVKAIAIPAGLAVQMANFRYVEAAHTMENLRTFQKRTNREGPTRMNTMEVKEASPLLYDFSVTGSCCFVSLFEACGMKELATVFCETDNAVFNVYAPDLILFDRGGTGNRIVDGATRCRFRCSYAKVLTREMEPEELKPPS